MTRVVEPRISIVFRISVEDCLVLDRMAREVKLTRSAWLRAVVRNRLHSFAAFPRDQELSLLAIRAELRHIGLQVKQATSVLQAALSEGAPLELELAQVEAIRQDLKRHMRAVGAAFEGSLAYWSGRDE